MKGRPDVVKKLDFDDRLQAASGQANGAPDDVSFRQRRVVNSRAAELPLQVRGDFEDSALALDLLQRSLTRAVGYVFAKDHDPRIALHLGVQASINQIDHRARIAA